MKRAARFLLLAVGLALFGWFIHQAGWTEIVGAFRSLGWAFPMVLIPFFFVYCADTLGWWFAFGRSGLGQIRFPAFFRVRWEGEAVNNVIPSAYIGGEALKVYLLSKRGLPASQGTASVVVGKTIQTLAQVIFISLGALVFLSLPGVNAALRSALTIVVAAGVGVIVLLFGLQRYGLFTLLVRVVEKLRLRIAWLSARKGNLRSIDDRIAAFYREERSYFLWSGGAYLAGWMLETVEIFLVAYLMEAPMHWTQAWVVAAFVGIAKALGLFVPGALGIQESGIVFLCRAAGLPDVFGVAYAILRRGREVVYALVGWLLLFTEEVSWKEWRQERFTDR